MSCCLGEAGVRVRISDVVRISDGYADFLSVGIRISYRWVPGNRVGAFILRSEDPTAIRSWADTFAVVATIPLGSIVEKRGSSPLQRYKRRTPSKRPTRAASSSLETRGPVCGFPTLGSRCTDMQISYRWVYGFLIVGFQGTGRARLFYDLKTLLLYAAGAILGLSG